MNIEKYIKKGLLYSLIFALIGIIAGIIGVVYGYQKDLMTGITYGFLPTGLISMLLYATAKKKPEKQKNIVLENEERNIFINTKAGYTAFWISYWYIFAALILCNLINISLLQFLKVTLFFMAVVYFSLVYIYHKKY